MKLLEQIIGSKGRAALFENLFTARRSKVHGRELARLTGLSAPSLMREAKALVRLGVLHEEKDGNRVDYSANENSPLYGVLCQLVEKTTGAEVTLSEIFSTCEADVIFIYGSRAKGNARTDSDYDLFVIGDMGLRTISNLVQCASKKIDVEVNPYVISPIEFKKRLSAGDHFLSDVMAGSKIFIKGSEDELRRLA